MASPVSRPDLALAAIRDGFRTSREIAAALGIHTRDARHAIKRLRREREIRWTGELVKVPGVQRRLRVWGVA